MVSPTMVLHSPYMGSGGAGKGVTGVVSPTMVLDSPYLGSGGGGGGGGTLSSR